MSNNEPLFQNMDEQERIYAPQQVPGAELPAEELDRGASAGQGTALADDRVAADEPGAEHSANIAGSDGDPGTVPVIPVRGDIGTTTPVALPASTEQREEQD